MPPQQKKKTTHTSTHEITEDMKDHILNLSQDLICIAGMDGYFKYLNPAWQNVLGYTTDVLMAEPFLDCIHPEDHAKANDKIEHISADHHTTDFEIRHIHKDNSIRTISWSATPDLENQLIYCIGRDITERKQSEEALHQTQAFNETLLNTLPDIIYIYDLVEWKNVYSNLGIMYVLGYSIKEIQVMGESVISDLMHPDDFKIYQEETIPRYQSVKDGELIQHEYRMKHKDGAWRWLLAKESIFMRLDDGTPKQIFGITSDITERKRAEEEMEKLSTIVKYSSELVNLSTLDGQMIFLNEAGCQMLGIEPEDVAHTNIMQVIPEHLISLVESELLPSLMKAETWEGDLQYLNLKTGKLTDVHAMTFTVQDPSTKELLYLANVSLDITERKHAEALIKKNLKEKEILLQEVNHRVKNNLNVISSLLNMQARKIQDQYALAAIAESRNRIQTMSLIHEKLYQSDSLADVDFASYISDLSNHLFKSYNISPDKINLKLNIEDIKLEVGRGITCGMMINELISNALEHAFPDNRTGEIQIEMKKVNNQYQLTVQDNGIGMPETIQPDSMDSLGLQLIDLFIQQLDGQYKIQRQNGTAFIIQFSVKDNR